MPNIFEPSWDGDQDEPPFVWRRARIGRQAGAARLGASVYEVQPGASTWPLHVHHANEELIIVLAGQLVLRAIDREQILAAGDVFACPAGRDGAHRLDNRSDEPARVLVISTMVAPELNEYPDSGKLWGLAFAPGAEHDADAPEIIGRPADNLDYFAGEE